MRKIIRIRTWRKLVLAVLILSMIPILAISFYNHSSADDYAYGILTRHAWMQTHNLIALFAAVGKQVQTTYLTWQGTYAAVTLFSLQPAVFGEHWYFLVTWVLAGMFIFGNFYFFRVIFGRIGGRKDIADIIAGVVILLSMQTLPHALQSFYWWNGGSYYTLFYSLMLIQSAVYAQVIYSGQWSRRSA